MSLTLSFQQRRHPLPPQPADTSLQYPFKILPSSFLESNELPNSGVYDEEVQGRHGKNLAI